MCLWSVKKLVEDFRSGRVTEQEQFKYYAVFTIFTVLFIELITYEFLANNPWKIINSAVNVLLTFLGLLVLYTANKKGDNRDFIVRTVCLSVPIGAQLVFYNLLIGVGIGIIEEITARTIFSDAPDPGDVGFTIVVWFIMIVWMRQSIIAIAQNE